jgi:muramoyltetrapeptide carboxypeptidase
MPQAYNTKVQKINRFLKIGDNIEIIAPASSCSVAEFKAALAWLKAQGFNPVYHKDILNPEKYLAQSDQYRFKYLKKALTNKQTKAIWCLRGGYGSLRLVPDLLKLKKSGPKFFIGLSDITVLHHFLNAKWNWSTIHGPVLARVASENKRAQDYDELFSLMTGQSKTVSFKNLIPLNLCTYCTLLGTKLQPKLKNHFIFFEDSAERGYKVDRMLHQLKQAGQFENCKAVFFGDFVSSLEANGENLVSYAIEQFFKDYKIPVFSGVESDHSEKQRPLILNAPARLIKDKNQTAELTVRIS